MTARGSRIGGGSPTASNTTASKRKRRPEKDDLIVDITPDDIREQGGDFKTNARWRRTMSNTPYPNAVLDQIPAPRGRGSASRISPIPTADQIAEKVDNFERTFYAARTTAMPFTWLLRQDETDLSFLGDPEISTTLLTEMYQNEEFRAIEDRWNKRVSDRTEEILEGRRNQGNFMRSVERIGSFFGTPEDRLGITPADEFDEVAERQKARQQAELELLGNPAPDRESMWDRASTPGGLNLGDLVDLVGKTIVLAASAGLVTGGTVLKGISGGRVDPLAYMDKVWQEQLDGQRAEYVEILTQPEIQAIERARSQFAEGWSEAALADPNMQEVVTMGLGNPATVRALMETAANLMFDESPELQNQVMADLEAETTDLISELDRNGNEISGHTASMIGWYGHNIPNRLATYATVLYSQEDISDFFTSEGFLNIHEEAVAANFSPSKVLGIDGTTMGIAFDFGMGGIFDPLNLFIGPAGRAMGINTVAQAARVARAPATRQILRDTAKAVRSYFRDDAASVALLEGFDEFGMYDEFVANAVGVERVFSGRPWLSHRSARVTKEVPVQGVLDRLPDDVVAEGRRQADAVRSGPFEVNEGTLLLDQPAVLQYSKVTGGVTMGADDVARLLLAQDVAGTTSVAFPVYGRVIDDLAEGTVRVLDDVRANPNDYVYHASKGPIEGRWTGGGISHRPMTRTDAGAASGERLYFKRSDIANVLDERARKYFEAGGDIERILPQGYKYPAGESPRPNRPIATGPMPQPVARLSRDELARYENPASTRVLDERVNRLPDNTNEFGLLELLDDNALYPELKGIMPRLEAMTERLYARGGGQALPMKTTTSRIFANDIRQSLRESKSIGPWALRYWTRQNVGNFIRTRGFGWEGDIRQNILRMFGHDETTANLWLRRFREALRPGADQADIVSLRLEIRQAADRLKFLEDNSGGILGRTGDDAIDLTDEVLEAESVRLAEELNTAKATHARLVADENRALIAAQKRRGVAAQRVIEDMWDDFNRRYIATNPFWKAQVDPQSGLVPYEVITGGTRKASARSGLTVPAGIEGGENANSIINQLMDDLGDPGVMVPLAPIDMIAASELGGAKWLQWEQIRFAKKVQDMGNFLDRLWKMDKVFRISTALTVSFDELIRVFHRYGAPAVMQWMEDRVMFTSARAKGLFAPNRAPSGAGRLGDVFDPTRAVFKNKRWNNRIQRLNEYPEFYKHVERQYYEMFEDSWDDIAPGEAEWLPAMDAWTNNLVQNDGFRAYLRGREEFSKWWNSEEAGHVRNRSTFDFGDGRTRIATEDEAWGGFDFLMNRVFLGKVRGGRTEAVRKAFLDAADRVASGEQAVSIPQNLLREMQIPVRGVRNLAPSASSAGKLSNQFFDNLFMAPTNYRRGFISEIARKYETRRLYELYQSQGINIIPDWKLGTILPEYNVRNTAAFGLPEVIEQMLFDKSVVTQGTIARMAERKAMAEMEHIMYTWHQTSRAGRSPALRATFPFGKPYFDMWAHYGREMLTRPALRGYINNTNFGMLANKALDRFPINPKAPALVSRIAATDFNAQKENMNFSPLLFFPTEGENSMLAVLPGVGALPMWMIDWVIANVYDPFEEPVEYQALTESVANWIPPIGFQQTGFAGRLFGGGAIATGFKAAVDAFMLGSNQTFHEPLSLIGDIQNEIQTNRAVKAILGDPEEWEVLLAAEEHQLPALFEALIGDAFGRGAGSHLADISSRWFVPVDLDFDTTDDDVQDVWLTAAEKFPVLAPRNFTRDASEDTLAEHADDIRRAFFNLSGAERDLMLVQYPQLAVNLVSGWEWTTKAQNEFPAEANTPYRTIGGSEGLARHQSYIRNDYVRPIAAPALMARIMGTVFEARVNLATQLYTDQANKVNDYIWENVMPPAGRKFFDDVVAEGIVDASSGQEVWQNLETYREKLEAEYGSVGVPERLQAWGTSWRGLEEEGFSQRFREITLGEEWSEFTPQLLQRAAALDIEMEVGMTGEQFVAQIHDVIRENVAGSALPSFVKDEFDSYRDARNAPANAARLTLNQLTAGENGDPVFKQAVTDFLNYESRTGALRNENGLVDPERARNVVEQYKQLMTSSPELNFSWEEKWHDAFESSYGPLDYEYPQPPELNPDDFRNTYRPYVWDVQDGDTLVVSNEPSAPWLDLPGSRFDILSGGTPKKHSVRLLGVYAPELSTGEEGKEWMDRLTNAIMEANRNGIPIYLVRDSDATGNRNVDFFGRELAWLFIGNEPYYHPETIVPGS